MKKIENDKLEIKNLLDSYGVSTSLNFEREPSGVIHADIHNSEPLVYNASTTSALSLSRIEIKVDYLHTLETYALLEEILQALKTEYNVTNEQTDLNKGTITLRGNKLY